jgi:hypothetical protein
LPSNAVRRFLAASAAALLCPAAAVASPSQEAVDASFRTFASLGVDRVRVSLFWDHVAPAIRRQRKPSFPDPGPSWPGSYPRGAWERYDRIAVAAQRAGVGLLFSVTGPAPAWATPGTPRKEGIERPSPGMFREFVKAAGIRYSGSYPFEREPPPPRPPPRLIVGGTEILGAPQQSPPERSPSNIPRVDHWSIWNEPNYPSWLSPIWLANKPRRAAQMVAAAPHHYRRLVDAAMAALAGSGHGRDTVLIGETAPRGGKKPTQLGNAMAPAEFVRELYCLRPSFRPYRGRAARLRGCPDTARERRRFRARHPGLFRSGGWAHHPYSLDRRRWRLPTWRHPIRDNVPIGNLRHLTRTLDRAAFRWGSKRPPMRIWFTEYGYQTKPHDPLTGVRPTRQGPLSAWGEYLAYRNPRVASVAQFLLVDDGPVPGYRDTDPRRWVSWQSGLLTRQRRAKPFLRDYQLPLHVRQNGRRARVFAGFRPARRGVVSFAQVQFARPGRRYMRVSDHSVRNPQGYLSLRVRIPGRGRLRVAWYDPRTNGVVFSASAPVR